MVNEEKRMKFENDQFYMKTEAEMREALADFPEACKPASVRTPWFCSSM